jgi:hypothetical protein
MKVLSMETSPCWEFRYRNVAPGSKQVVTASLPVYRATVDHLPDTIGAIVCASDLQGHMKSSAPAMNGKQVLMGIELPGMMRELAAQKLIPRLNQCGAVLAGDLFALTNRRGGLGNCLPVWQAWSEEFKFVVGVAGNHDAFGDSADSVPDLIELGMPNAKILDGDQTIKNSLKIAGLSGCVGNPKRPFRYTEDVYQKRLVKTVRKESDILILHDGPNVPPLGEEFIGQNRIREVLESLSYSPLVLRGHRDWPQAMAELSNGIQVINLESRIIVLMRETPK